MKSNFRLLVAEDDPDDALLLQIAFFRAGIKVPMNFVQDGVEVIEFLEGSGPFADREAYPLPTMLLLDIKMPRRTGFDVLEWIKQQPTLRRMVVIVFSSSDIPRDIDRAYDLGANSYLVKTNIKELPRLLEEMDAYWRKTNQFPEVA